MSKFVHLILVLLGILTAAPSLAKNELTKAEVQAFEDIIKENKRFSTILSLVTDKSLSDVEKCARAKDLLRQEEAAIQQAYLLIKKYASEGKSTDSLHKDYIDRFQGLENYQSIRINLCRDEYERSEVDDDYEFKAIGTYIDTALTLANQLAPTDPLNACAQAGLAVEHSQDIFDEYNVGDMFKGEEIYALYKSRLKQSERRLADAKAAKTRLCAKVSFKDRPPEPPLPPRAKGPDDEIYVIVARANLASSEHFVIATRATLSADWAGACKAFQSAQTPLLAAIDTLNIILAQRNTDNKDTKVVLEQIAGLKQFIEDVKQTSKKACVRADQKNTVEALDAQIEQTINEFVLNNEEIKAAVNAQDRPRLCSALKKLVNNNSKILGIFEDYLELDLSAQELTVLKQMQQDFQSNLKDAIIQRDKICQGVP
jgi:hypothetical protein